MEKPSLSRSQSVDERSMGQDVDGDSVRERSVHGGSFSREASFRGGNANDRSFRGGRGGGDRDQDRSVHSTTSAVPPSSSSSRPPLPRADMKKNDKNGINGDDEVELGHHHGLSVAARPAAAAAAPPGAAAASAGLAAAPPPAPPPPHAKFYLEEYDHDLYGAPLWAWPRAYFRKMRGGLDTPMPFPDPAFAVLATLGALLGIACVGGLDVALGRREILDSPVLLASFGASAVLLFSVPESKLSQPVNFVGGQCLSAATGATVRLILSPDRGCPHWLTSAVGVAAAVLLMMLTSTTHPPGGATALIAATVSRPAPWHGFRLVFSVGIGCLGMQVVALLLNNLHRGRRYPSRWIGMKGLP